MLLGGGAQAYQLEQSLRFDPTDDTTLTVHTGWTSQRTWTWSCWVKFANPSSEQYIWLSRGTNCGIYVNSSRELTTVFNDSNVSTGIRLRDPSAWYHIVVKAEDYSSASPGYSDIYVYLNGELVQTRAAQTRGYFTFSNQTVYIGRYGNYTPISYEFDGYMAEMHMTDGYAYDPTDFGEYDSNGVWRPIEVTGLNYGSNGFYHTFDTSASNGIGHDHSGNGNHSTPSGFSTGSVDYAATGADPSSKIQSGSYQDFWDGNTSTGIVIGQGAYVQMTSTSLPAATSTVGFYTGNGASTAYLRINGTDEFNATSTTIQWWDFSFSGAINKVEIGYLGGSGSSNTYRAFRIDGTTIVGNPGEDLDVLSDTPTTNWCTLNPLEKPGGTAPVYENGNLTLRNSTNYFFAHGVGTFGLNSGKWYFETSGDGTIYVQIGFVDSSQIASMTGGGGITGANISWHYQSNGIIRGLSNTYQDTGLTAASTAGDIMALAIDFDAGEASWYVNGTQVGSTVDFSSYLTDSRIWYPVVAVTNEGTDVTNVNFGQRDFAYTPPTGFKALNTSNLPVPDIADGSDYFAALVGPGDTETAWSETNTAISVSGGQLTTYDGLANTNYLLGLTDTKYPPIDFIRSLRELELDGYDDWYIGSKYEMEVIYYNLKPTTDNNTTVASSQDNSYSVPQRTSANYTTSSPAQTSVTAFQSGGAQAFDSETSTGFIYYTSSPASTSAANGKSFTATGIAAGYNYDSGQKYSENGLTRAIRRVAYTGSEPSLGAAYGGGYYAGLYSLNGDGTATHALIVSDKANGENTGMKALVQQKFSSGLYWIKDREATDEHKLIDSVRGLTNQLSSNSPSAETTYSDPDNASVAWNWLAGGSGTSNTVGDINSTVSAVPKAGFSIVTYSGTLSSTPATVPTVGHGLGVAPSLVISKSRNATGDDSGNWFVWHSGAGTGNWLRLNTNNAAASISTSGGGTMVAPTDTVFSTPYISGSNVNSNNYIAYCFAEVEGYSKFGSYVGNNTSDNAFVYCGFAPAWLMVKSYGTGGTNYDWRIYDSQRNTYNPVDDHLEANSGLNENGDSRINAIDFLSNGFKIRNSYAEVGSSTTYVFAAFSEHPFGGNGVSPVTAR